MNFTAEHPPRIVPEFDRHAAHAFASGAAVLNDRVAVYLKILEAAAEKRAAAIHRSPGVRPVKAVVFHVVAIEAAACDQMGGRRVLLLIGGAPADAHMSKVHDHAVVNRHVAAILYFDGLGRHARAVKSDMGYLLAAFGLCAAAAQRRYETQDGVLPAHFLGERGGGENGAFTCAFQADARRQLDGGRNVIGSGAQVDRIAKIRCRRGEMRRFPGQGLGSVAGFIAVGREMPACRGMGEGSACKHGGKQHGKHRGISSFHLMRLLARLSCRATIRFPPPRDMRKNDGYKSVFML